MNLRISNQLSMAGACLNVAENSEFKPVWQGREPADFETDLAQLKADYDATMVEAAQIETAPGGPADAKAAAEATLEELSFVMARGLANHFRKTGALDYLAKVDVTRTNIVCLRNERLVSRTMEIRDLAEIAASESGAAHRGVTAARVAALTAAIITFIKVMDASRDHIVNRSTLLKEIETDTARLVEQVNDLDDLVLQFTGETAERFKLAWKCARSMADSGGVQANGVAARRLARMVM